MSAQSEGHFSKKSKSSTSQQQYSTRPSMALPVASFGQSSLVGLVCFGCHQPRYRIVDCLHKGQQRWQSQQKGPSCSVTQEQSHDRGPPTCYQCGQVGHVMRQWTQRKDTQGVTGSQQPTQSVQASRATPAFTLVQSRV